MKTSDGEVKKEDIVEVVGSDLGRIPDSHSGPDLIDIGPPRTENPTSEGGFKRTRDKDGKIVEVLRFPADRMRKKRKRSSMQTFLMRTWTALRKTNTWKDLIVLANSVNNRQIHESLQSMCKIIFSFLY